MTGVDEGYAQIPEESAPPFGANIGGEAGVGGLSVGGEGHIDGTPMRVSFIVILALVVLLLLHYADLRFHVTI